jgi:hypothetical protein
LDSSIPLASALSRGCIFAQVARSPETRFIRTLVALVIPTTTFTGPVVVSADVLYVLAVKARI